MGDDATEGREEEVGIMVFAQEADNGNTQVGFRLMGGFSILAVPTVLELAAKAARQQLGLGE